MLKQPDSHGEANILLSHLPDDVRVEVGDACRPIKLALGDMLIPAGGAIEGVFFLLSGIASVVVVTKSGRKTEAGVVGKGVRAGGSRSWRGNEPDRDRHAGSGRSTFHGYQVV